MPCTLRAAEGGLAARALGTSVQYCSMMPSGSPSQSLPSTSGPTEVRAGIALGRLRDYEARPGPATSSTSYCFPMWCGGRGCGTADASARRTTALGGRRNLGQSDRGLMSGFETGADQPRRRTERPAGVSRPTGPRANWAPRVQAGRQDTPLLAVSTGAVHGRGLRRGSR